MLDVPASPRPLISVIMANYNGARYLRTAIDSVLAQTQSDLELIVSDDASTDESRELVEGYETHDPRVRLVIAGGNGGPARARNRALDAARGDWIAIVDSDDILHPERFERLLATAERFDADAVADDLLHFASSGHAPASLLLDGDDFTNPFRLTPSLYVRGDIHGSTIPNFGYLKPMIRSASLAGARYDETLRIGEDYDLVLRLLLRGLRFQVTPEPTYLYRRHDKSISHRLSVETVADMIACQKSLQERHGVLDPEIESALAARMRGLERGLDYEKLVAALKARNVGNVVALLARRPSLAGSLVTSVRSRFERSRVSAPDTGDEKSVTIILTDLDPRSERVEALTSAAASDAVSEIRVEQVPLYSPPGSVNDEVGVERELWRRLATIGRRKGTRLLVDGPAGLYAAGFIPSDDVPETWKPVADRIEERARAGG
ncbi:glycosyltransferase family 2 protein [Mesorhizobium sp. CAU 1732]|uniref:glycosyltransferase family 2 protein n=1 Tax=Mesorhizobium sp. CAU 1732 TaxID=3140358 RepID=UPI0032619E98